MDLKQEYREETNKELYTVELMEQRVEYISNDYVKWLEAKINYLHSCTAERTVKGEKALNYDEFKEKWFDEKEGIIYVDRLTTEIVDVNFILNTYQEYCNRL